MKIAFTSQGTHWDAPMDPRFGRTAYIALFDEGKNEIKFVNNQELQEGSHGAGTATAQKIFELQPDILITGNGPGDKAAIALQQTQIKIFVHANDMSLREAYRNYQEGKLTAL